MSLKNHVLVHTFLRNHVFIHDKKHPLANFRVELFSCLASEHSWWKSPSINPAFSSFKTWTVPAIASWQCTTNDWGYVLSSEPQTLRQALTSSMSFYKYQSAIRGEKEKEMLVFVYMVYAHFFKRKKTRASSFYHCFTILRLRKCGIIYTRFHAFYVHMSVELFLHAFIHFTFT